MKKIIIIPARLSSTRLENKVIMDLNGKTLIQRVFENAKKAKVSDVYIATDSLKIKEICKSFTKNIIITSNNHKTGTDRIAEASKNIDSDIVLNIQSDEPFINVETINKMIDLFLDPNVYMTSSMYKLSNKKEFDDPNQVKVAVNSENYAIFFTRFPHTFNLSKIIIKQKINQYYVHQGIYGFKKEFLEKYSTLNQSYLERFEKLEQLRVLENGYKIKMIESKHKSIGIDTLEDYNEAIKFLNLKL
tara:strand:- start:72081 stop:72818 length:738 start_codon:yes stop_codon:yes gene_type:complete